MSLGLDLSNAAHVDIKAVSASALRALPDLLQDWLPGGRREGQAGRRDAKLLRANALLEFMQRRSGEEILIRDILQLGPADTRTKGPAEEALDILKAHGWVVEASSRPRSFRVVA